MFYLYIDEILISSYHSFSEVRDFIFDFYLDVVKGVIPLDQYTDQMDKQMDYVIQGLICHQYEYFKIYDHEVQVYYGS